MAARDCLRRESAHVEVRPPRCGVVTDYVTLKDSDFDFELESYEFATNFATTTWRPSLTKWDDITHDPKPALDKWIVHNTFEPSVTSTVPRGTSLELCETTRTLNTVDRSRENVATAFERLSVVVVAPRGIVTPEKVESTEAPAESSALTSK